MKNPTGLIMSSSPHIRADEDTRSIMLDVVIALIPALAVAVYVFGWRALALTCVSTAACVFFEWAYRKLMKKPSSIGDLSAAVTGILLAFCMPVSVPYWVPVVGAFFAVVIVKQLFGGLGKNFMNPALAARAFLFSWPVIMTTWVSPLADKLPLLSSGLDAVTAATPLSYLANGTLPAGVSFYQAFLGQTGGCLGETPRLMLLLGGIYLVVRRVLSPRIPLAYLGTVAVLTLLFPRGHEPFQWMLSNLLSGGLVLGAVFMATDYVTSPVTGPGRLLYGVGCGALTVFIRYFGSNPEGVTYAILIMNACVWFLDRSLPHRRFGVLWGKRGGGKGAA